ncbi:restriction endonuclease [Verrucomicrobiota bacterium]
MEPLIFIAIVAIIFGASYISSVRQKLKCGEKAEEDSRRYYHETRRLSDELDSTQNSHAEAVKSLKKEASEAISKIRNRCAILEHALEERELSEPWLASYIAQLKMAEDEKALEKKRGYRTIKALEKRFREKYKPSVQENIILNARLAEYESLFPTLPDHIEKIKVAEIDHQMDGGRSWLSDEEFSSLSALDRNQLVLDRYHDGKHKSKWQIGRDYELYIGHIFKRKGYTKIIQYGIEKKLEDLGIDVIATNPQTGKTAYIQCKHWSKHKMIRENTVTQLYAGALIHMLNNNESPTLAEFYICTSTKASDLAKECAKILGVTINENIPISEYPSIKCHNGELGSIYHLPIDQMYDRTYSVDHYTTTCAEAESKGYRRAFRWHG